MGFTITGDFGEKKVTSLKQNINLSNNAWNIIKEDMFNFCSKEDENNLSGFLNRIFASFHNKAKASVSLRKKEQTDKYKKYKQEEGYSEALFNKIIDNYAEDLLTESLNYPKGEAKKFTLNKNNLETLRRSHEVDYYRDGKGNENLGKYLKAIFEEYALKRPFERELIYFSSYVDMIELAIKSKAYLEIVQQERTSKHGNKIQNTYFFSPYKIVVDDTLPFNYLIGYSELANQSDGSIIESKIAPVRISRIVKMSIVSKNESASLSSLQKKAIDDELEKKSPAYLVGDILDIEVKFTQKGLEQFKKQILMRPNIYYKLKEEKNYTHIVFKCTEAQAINYFFKFGSLIEIISPNDVRTKFINRYKEGLEIYQVSNEYK